MKSLAKGSAQALADDRELAVRGANFVTLSILHAPTRLPKHWTPCCFAGPAKEALQPYVAFHAALRSAHMSFVSKLESQARTLLQHHLDTATSEFALSMMAQMPDVYAQPALEATRSSRGAMSALGDDTENVPPPDADEGVMQVRQACARALY